MESTKQILTWADTHVKALNSSINWRDPLNEDSGFWEASNPRETSKIRARTNAALAFLERFTGSDSRWTQAAHGEFESGWKLGVMEHCALAIADIIIEWIAGVDSGQVKPRIAETLGARAVASTDLMEQVRVLNSDQNVTPAAPIVLSGAALEIALRSAVDELELSVSGQPSITAYARELRSADVLGKQEMKDVEQMAGVRNQAAHGEHDTLSPERAGLMEQQVNLFLKILEDALEKSA
ncbi:MAG: hypothetical protein F4Z02_00180 [Acidimicrobiia bacterium]|nr:hypothetical protein [Acidimicrobiia bacterium]MYG73649.1 hypothetical protein [Acidimicrobiia bacterium]